MVKHLFLAAACLAASYTAQAQVKVFKFWVEFSDKQNSPYSVDRPLEFLSQRALDRRAKHGIKVTEQDFPVNPKYKEGLSAAGVTVLHTSRWFNAATIRTTDSSLIDKIKALPYVKSADLLYHRVEFEGTKKGPSQVSEYLRSAGGSNEPSNSTDFGEGFRQIDQINGVQLHKDGFQGQGMLIAVLDAGFYHAGSMKTFDKLRNEGRLWGIADLVDFDSSVYEDDLHGMNVLSCMAAYAPGKFIGTAPKANYWLIRTEDANTEYPIEEANWVAGAEMADSLGADLINSSLGYTKFGDADMDHTFQSLNGKSIASRAATLCAHKGLLVCNAAGNEGDGSWKFVGVPADADSILTVGGVDADNLHASFSSYGPTADGRIKPTIVARAAGTIVASSKDKYYNSNGTSFASPVMCGMVACLMQANPKATIYQVMDALKWSASQASNPDNILGWGIPDFKIANRILGGDKLFDYGKSRWLEAIPATYYNSLRLAYYSSQDQHISIVVKKGRKVLKTIERDLKKGEFMVEQLKDLPNKRKGITIEVKVGDSIEKFSLKPKKP
ncbi:MAG: hypothetical protein EP332_13290 [Bacteroidetes bacterium]|nr:MAG: hypothetical protein EP332_13290 [Bacteroidota bacterium]